MFCKAIRVKTVRQCLEKSELKYQGNQIEILHLQGITVNVLIQCAPNLKQFLTLIIQCTSILKDNFQGTQFSAHFLLFWKFRRRKSTQIALEFFSYFTKSCIIQNTQYSKLFQFTIDPFVLLDERDEFFFHEMSFFCLRYCIEKIPSILVRKCL